MATVKNGNVENGKIIIGEEIYDYTGTGTADDPYVIYTAAGFAALFNGTSFTDSRYYKLGADIDMTGVTYMPNKQNGSSATVEFDGNGKTITGLTPSENNGINWGVGAFFGQSKGNVVIKNLTIVGLSLVSTGHKMAGGLIGYASSGKVTITNCNVSGSVTYSGTEGSVLGGLVSYISPADCYFENCVVDVDCTVTAAPASGNITIGGVAGNLEKGSTFKNCKGLGELAYTGEEYTAGAIRISAIIGNDEKGTSSIINESPLDDVTFSVRLKLTDDFGFMAIAEGVDGFVFTTDANADVTALEKVAGLIYNGTSAVYAVYTDLWAAHLDTTIYFAAYAMIDGQLQFTELKAINVYEVATDLQDGIYGNDAENAGVTVTTDETEMFLYVKMCEYCDAYKAYLAKNIAA